MCLKSMGIALISIHALRVEGDLLRSKLQLISLSDFYPRPPCGGRQTAAEQTAQRSPISIHALRVEGDSFNFYAAYTILTFLSTPSVWRATWRLSTQTAVLVHFYPRPPCGGRQLIDKSQHVIVVISIHALRVEGDGRADQQNELDLYFYPRPPCGGRRGQIACFFGVIQFLSTPSVRRATDFQLVLDAVSFISIHALRAEGDMAENLQSTQVIAFLSTPSVRRATSPPCGSWCFPDISIHALRAEGDTRCPLCRSPYYNFYPRPPCGGRPCGVYAGRSGGGNISIHALRAEGDSKVRSLPGTFFYFYPRPPCGGRPAFAAAPRAWKRSFLSTPSVRRATGNTKILHSLCPAFLSTPSVRRATGCSRALFP